jgi:3-phenylpropionate/trans-cinnamate dioxygenase ferredoxin subunit
MPRHVVATVDEIPPGGRKVVTVDDREIVVFNLGGEFVGLLNRCPHQGGKLCDGVVTAHITSDEPGTIRYDRPGEIIRCPWHGWFFDLRTGRSWGEPERIKTRHYDAAVADGSALVEGPFQAETVDVSTNKQYVVIET